MNFGNSHSNFDPIVNISEDASPSLSSTVSNNFSMPYYPLENSFNNNMIPSGQLYHQYDLTINHPNPIINSVSQSSYFNPDIPFTNTFHPYPTYSFPFLTPSPPENYSPPSVRLPTYRSKNTNRKSRRKPKSSNNSYKNGDQQKACENCLTQVTPSWRRDKKGEKLLCNACGLYEKLHDTARPVTWVKGQSKLLRMKSSKNNNGKQSTELVCEHCRAIISNYWKYTDDDRILCAKCVSQLYPSH